MADPRPTWHLGFDCATKTFAFSLSEVKIPEKLELTSERLNNVRLAISKADKIKNSDPSLAEKLVKEATRVLAGIKEEINGSINLVDGEAVDLVPGRADKSVSTVERIRALAQYVKTRVKPSVAKHVPAGEKLRVVIEYQMGQNPNARAVSSALVALFADDDVIIVSPTLKNKIHTCEEGRYNRFAMKYQTSYSANKAHTIFNFNKIEEVFGTSIPVQKNISRGHIADSFMQVLGYLIYGPGEDVLPTLF